MKKYLIVVVLAILFIGSLWFVKDHYDTESKMLREFEKENAKLRMLAERRELQFKIATYESKMNLRVAKPVPKPLPAPKVPVDPNQ